VHTFLELPLTYDKETAIQGQTVLLLEIAEGSSSAAPDIIPGPKDMRDFLKDDKYENIEIQLVELTDSLLRFKRFSMFVSENRVTES